MFEDLSSAPGPVINNRPNKLLLTYEDAADALSISPTMLRKMARLGRLQVVHLGRAVRVPSHELLRLAGADSNPSEVTQ